MGLSVLTGKESEWEGRGGEHVQERPCAGQVHVFLAETPDTGKCRLCMSPVAVGLFKGLVTPKCHLGTGSHGLSSLTVRVHSTTFQAWHENLRASSL